MKTIYTSLILLVFSLSTNAQQGRSLKYQEGDEILKVVEKMPMYPGCDDVRDVKEQKKCSEDLMLDYIYTNIVYPKKAIERNVQGKAILQFVVQKDGTIGNVKCLRDPGTGTGQAAIDVMYKMNQDKKVWSPGMQRGKLVHVLYTLPINFSMSFGDEKDPKQNANQPVYIPEDAFEINTNDALNFPPPPPPPPPAPEEELFKVVEQMPRFPGCEDQGFNAKELTDCSNEKMVRYIYQNLNYPKTARKNGTQGKVILQFVVQKNGKLTDVKVVRDPGDGCGNAAKSVMDQMSNEKTWTPGKQRGRPVKVLYTLPINFKL